MMRDDDTEWPLYLYGYQKDRPTAYADISLRYLEFANAEGLRRQLAHDGDGAIDNPRYFESYRFKIGIETGAYRLAGREVSGNYRIVECHYYQAAFDRYASEADKNPQRIITREAMAGLAKTAAFVGADLALAHLVADHDYFGIGSFDYDPGKTSHPQGIADISLRVMMKKDKAFDAATGTRRHDGIKRLRGTPLGLKAESVEICADKDAAVLKYAGGKSLLTLAVRLD